MLVKVICRSMGYAHGSVSSSPCGFYGAADLCGAAGSPVAGSLLQRFNSHSLQAARVCKAMADLKCSGSEWSVEDKGLH